VIYKKKKAFFILLCKYFKLYKKDGLVSPKAIKKLNNDYMALSDDLYEWVGENMEKVEKTSEKLKDVFAILKQSEYYRNLDKMDKRNFNYKSFINKMESNLFLGKYVERNSSDVYVINNYKLKLNVDE
jgi:hypothetical protein